jgi:hypothetical protein
MYSWSRIAARTEVVYHDALRQPCDGALGSRLTKLLGCGPFLGILAVLMAALDHIWLCIVLWLDPETSIERAYDLVARQSSQK